MKGQFGEPWHIASKPEYEERNVRIVDNSYRWSVAVADSKQNYEDNLETGNRIVTCVNALDGFNPEAVKEVIEAGDKLFKTIDDLPEGAPNGTESNLLIFLGALEYFRAALDKAKTT